MFHRLGTAVVNRAGLVLAVGLVAILAAAYLAVGAFDKLQTEGFDDPASESTRAAQLLEDEFGGSADYVILVSASEGTVDEGEARSTGESVTRELEQDAGLHDIVSYFETGSPTMRSADGEHAIILANTADGPVGAEPAEVVDRYQEDTSGATVRVGGGEAIGEEIGAQIGEDLGLAESIAMSLILVLLVLAFGNVVAALVTLAVGVVAIIGTFGELSVLGSLTDVSIYSVNLTIGLGLGLAVDYGLLMVARVREERAGGRTGHDSVVRAVETAGRTIVFSATTVAVALAALLVFPLYFLRSFAYAGIGVMVITAVSAVVLLPAALALLGDRIDAWRVPGVRGIRGGPSPFWTRIARFVMRRPLVSALPVLALFLLMAAPLLGISFGTPDDRVLPTSASSRQVGDVLRDEFSGDDTGAISVVTTSALDDQALTTYAGELSGLPDVERVESRLGTFVAGTGEGAGGGAPPGATPDAERILVVTDVDRRSEVARSLVTTIRDLPDPAGSEALVGGATAELVDSMDAISSRLPIALGWMAVTTLVILFLFTGSVVQPVRALVLNVLGLGATLGAMVWIFQDGHFSDLLGFTPQPMDTSMMVLLFCIAFGLSMDYEVFVMSRIKEMRDLGLAHEEAVVAGMAHTGRIVSTAAALIAISFFAFLVSSVSFIQFFGLGTGLAILIDATLVRGVLLPASMRLLGEKSWWAPRPLRAVHRRLGLSESVPDARELEGAGASGVAR